MQKENILEGSATVFPPEWKPSLGGVEYPALPIDLLSVYPEIAAEWHPHKNKKLALSDVTIGSGARVWWRCSKCGHEWQEIVYKRTQGCSCPICAKAKRK